MKKKLKKIKLKNNKFISFSMDTLAKACYIRYSNDPVAKTEALDGSVNIDCDKDGKVVGIEIIRISRAESTINKLVKDAQLSFSKKVRKEVDPLIKPILSY